MIIITELDKINTRIKILKDKESFAKMHSKQFIGLSELIGLESKKAEIIKSALSMIDSKRFKNIVQVLTNICDSLIKSEQELRAVVEDCKLIYEYLFYSSD